MVVKKEKNRVFTEMRYLKSPEKSRTPKMWKDRYLFRIFVLFSTFT